MGETNGGRKTRLLSNDPNHVISEFILPRPCEMDEFLNKIKRIRCLESARTHPYPTDNGGEGATSQTHQSGEASRR